MTGWIKTNNYSWSKQQKKLYKDIGEDLKNGTKKAFSELDTYYFEDSDKKDSIVHDETAKVVGSEEWAVAASDTGKDWIWKKEPPYEKIKDWLIRRQGISKKDPKLHLYVKAAQKKILDEGIDSSYWVDTFLIDFTNPGSAP